jgi:integrase
VSPAWSAVTCTECGTTGPGRPTVGLCKRCYARRQHAPRTCVDCGQWRRHLATGRCARCYRLSLTRQRRCAGCDQIRPVWFADRCDRCKARARARLASCHTCGRQTIFQGRQCRRCAEAASQRIGACADCGCWTGLLGGRCKPCRLFRWKRPTGPCPSCGRELPLGAAGRCRGCLAIGRATGTIPNAATGIQLWLGVGLPARVRPAKPEPTVTRARVSPGQLRLPRAAEGRPPSRRPARPAKPTTPRRPRQLTPVKAAVDRPPPRFRPRRAQWAASVRHRAPLEALTRYGQARGWNESTLRRARRSLLTLLAELPPGAWPLEATAARAFLIERHLVALRALEFLTDHGLLAVDDQAVLDRWVAGRLQALPDPIRGEVDSWVEGLRGRGARAGHARQPQTIQGYLRVLQPALTDWAARYQSLRQVTEPDVTAQLTPVTGPTRLLALAAMRSLFGALKARRVIFTNPTAGLLGRHATPAPAIALDPGVRAGLLDRLDDPDQRLIVLLAGVHALRTAEICALSLNEVDLAAGTIVVGGRPRRLDALTRAQLGAWLERRRTRWPTTANPHLLVNRHTAGGVAPVARSFVHATCQRLGLTAQQLRVDRLLAEVHTTGGDPLKLTMLFGLSDPTAIRYCAERNPLDQAIASP